MLEELKHAPVENFSVGYRGEKFYIGRIPSKGIFYYIVCHPYIHSSLVDMNEEAIRELENNIWVRYHLPKQFKKYESNLFMRHVKRSFKHIPYYTRMSYPKDTDLELIFMAPIPEKNIPKEVLEFLEQAHKGEKYIAPNNENGDAINNIDDINTGGFCNKLGTFFKRFTTYYSYDKVTINKK